MVILILFLLFIFYSRVVLGFGRRARGVDGVQWKSGWGWGSDFSGWGSAWMPGWGALPVSEGPKQAFEE